MSHAHQSYKVVDSTISLVAQDNTATATASASVEHGVASAIAFANAGNIAGLWLNVFG